MAGAIREQPPRRSKRIAASRENSAPPSLASDEEDHEQPPQQQQQKERPVSEYTALRQHMTLSRISLPPSPVASAAPSPVEIVAETPVTAAVTAAVTATPARPSLLRRAFGFLSSPFGSHVTRPRDAASSLQQQYNPSPRPQEPLGELPVSRKRQAPEMEPEDESQSQMPQPKPERASAQKPAIALMSATPTRLKTPRGPSTLNRNHRSSLNAISEHTESSSANSRAPEPTPSRHRTISSVRSKRDQALNTPGRPRAWIRPPMPREPNADNRLAKLNHYNEMKEHMQSLEKDEEIREMVAHRTKRVKIDDLVYIPHNRPGDPSSTFRVYDDDSDDEMEVDEAVELRKNVFEEVTMKEPSPPKRQEPSRSKQQERSVEVIAQKVQPQAASQWIFPNVSKRKDIYQEGTAQEARLGVIFKMAFDHWTRTGEILPVF